MTTFAYLADGRLYLQNGESKPRELTSAFVRDFEERQARQQQHLGWKEQSGVWGEMGMARPGMEQWNQAPSQRQVKFRSVDRGPAAGHLTYLVDFGHMTGLFQYDPAADLERRLFHRNNYPAQDLHRHSTSGKLAMSVMQPDGTKRLVVCDADGRLPREITLGDSVDEMPRWKDDDVQQLVFQSAGVARDANGFAAALGPYAIQKLNLQNESLTTLIEDERYDYLQPWEHADGTLVYLRRPYKPGDRGRSGWTDLQDILLFPYRLVRAGFYFLNFFSVMFSGQPLRTAGGPERPAGADPRFLSLWGQMVDTRRKMQLPGQKADEQGLVPKDWQLIRRSPSGEETVLADGVLTFDIGSHGDILYSDGRRIWQRTSAGEVREVGKDYYVERVVSMA